MSGGRSVLDQTGHGEHGARRLGAVLRLLKGPPETLTPFLKGLDAAELMSLPAPEPGYRLTSEPVDAATEQLRRELEGLRVMVLQQRAATDGADSGQLEDAMDFGNPKQALIQLILERHAIDRAAAADADGSRLEELRLELDGLRMMALQKRAISEGVDGPSLEDAMDSDDPKNGVITLLLAKH